LGTKTVGEILIPGVDEHGIEIQKVEIPDVVKKFFAIYRFRNGLNIHFMPQSRDFLRKKVVSPREGYTVRVYQPVLSCGNKRVFTELGPCSEVDFAALFFLVKNQMKGEEGPLLTNGYLNVFHILSRNVWVLFDEIWSIGVTPGPPDNKYLWNSKHRIFAREEVLQ